MSERERLIRLAFDALAAGDLAPFRTLLAPDAQWIGVPQGRKSADTPTCPNRRAILDRLEHQHRSGRAFAIGDVIEEGDRVAVEVIVTDPTWTGTVLLFKVFGFASGENVVVRLNDCIDESYALQVLAA